MSSTPVPSNSDATHWHRDAQAHLAAGRYADAADLLSRLVLLVPDNDVFWTDLGLARFGAGHCDEARQAGLKAIDLMSVSLPAWSLLADVFAAAGQWEEALSAAVQQFELSPVVPDGLYKAAVAHAHLDDSEGAIRALEAALSQRRDLRPRMAADPSFAAIRTTAGFRQLLDD
jgi:tetratricopeptide (TPR) repeat protein